MFKSTVGALVFLLAAVSAGRFGCHNPHPYCKKDNHPKEACTDWGKDWKGWMEKNCPEKCGKCGGGGGGPPPPPGRALDGAAPPPSSLIKQAFYIFPPIPKGGGGAVAVERGEYGCGNQHPYCKKDNHPKEACTDCGKDGWKTTARRNVENVVVVVVDHQDEVDLGVIIHILTVRRTTIQRKHVQTGERHGKDGWKRTARRNVENVEVVVADPLLHLVHLNDQP